MIVIIPMPEKHTTRTGHIDFLWFDVLYLFPHPSFPVFLSYTHHLFTSRCIIKSCASFSHWQGSLIVPADRAVKGFQAWFQYNGSSVRRSCLMLSQSLLCKIFPSLGQLDKKKKNCSEETKAKAHLPLICTCTGLAVGANLPEYVCVVAGTVGHGRLTLPVQWMYEYLCMDHRLKVGGDWFIGVQQIEMYAHVYSPSNKLTFLNIHTDRHNKCPCTNTRRHTHTHTNCYPCQAFVLVWFL